MFVRKPAAALAALTLCFGLTACGGGGQSVADACSTAEKEVTDAMGDLSAIDPTDTDAAAEKLSTATEALKSTVDKLENTEVKDALDALTTEFEKMQTAFADLKAAGTDTAKLQELSTTLGTISTSVQEKGENLDQLCN